ncbi:PEP_CTERM-anchored TLD domain-containing protein [Rugamonas rubra]|uniref:VPLPA-CTERM protein sorting domain-containing protein n=1 Tax=Rugamonas rubra TaxID=758825 RepID=A0A1I4KZQ2_9BURK|nr:PEP_CTERM-anchored TLD domain-containing protein [Rugamonas rubra]SFL84063.1 VPLPA-CTERM protein sorting domain-containing protein [Rugamonas rubra]
MKARSNIVPAVLAIAATFGACGNASADVSLLSPAYQSQLASWLGSGPLSLTNIYTKAAGDTALDFHHAVDGKGATFSVMEASNGKGQTWVIGGYNPRSWASSGEYNMTYDNAQRTSFLFNLTAGQIHRQTPKGYVYDTVGAYQAYNNINSGPTFGMGRDLYVPYDLQTGGVSLLYSYIDPNEGNFYASILDGSRYTQPDVTYGAIQVFSIAVVPEPSAYLMLLLGLGGLAILRRGKAAA